MFEKADKDVHRPSGIFPLSIPLVVAPREAIIDAWLLSSPL